MSNPVLNEKFISPYNEGFENGNAATIQGTVWKTLVSLGALCLASLYTFVFVFMGFVDKASLFATIGLIVSFIVSMVIIFARPVKFFPVLTILYSIFEGLTIGAITGIYYINAGSSVVFNAVCATLLTFIGMLLLYSAKIIKCTERFKSVMLIAMFGILAFYLITFVVGFFNPTLIKFLYGGGLVGFGINIIICIVAAFNFIIDFDIIEKMSQTGVNKNFEWYGAFSLMLTIVWLYIEFLKLFARRR